MDKQNGANVCHRSNRGFYKGYLYRGTELQIPKRTLRRWKNRREKKITRDQERTQNLTDMDEPGNSESISMRVESRTEQHGEACDPLLAEGIFTDRNQNEMIVDASLSESVHEYDPTNDDTQSQDTSENGSVEGNSQSIDQVPAAAPDDTPTRGQLPDESRSITNNLSNDYGWDVLSHALLVVAMKLRHGLTWVATEDLSELLSVEHQSYEKLSTYKLKKIIRDITMGLSIHHVCSTCHYYVGKSDYGCDGPGNTILTCKNCGKISNTKENMTSGSFFLYMSLEQQLRMKFEKEDLSLYARNRVKHNEFAIEDIMDGTLYRDGADEGTISITFNIDGVPIFERSHYSALPILSIINEVPPKDRRKHMMLISVWCGKDKPKIMSEYLRPFIEEAKKLYNQGFDYMFEGKIYHKGCRVLVGICDSVARPPVQKMYQFNGEYGCPLCLNPGEMVEKGEKGGHVRIYEIDADGNAYGEGLRNKHDTLHHAIRLVKGVRGRSSFYDIPNFDPILGFPADWMHAVLLGICRQFAKLWFDTTNHKKQFYFRQYLKTIDELIASYTPTTDASRIPQNISDAGHMKAHELCIWLLTYSLVTLKGILPTKYVEHWSLLVEGISILMKTSIMKSEVYYAHNCLIRFVQGVKSLYGKEHMSFNVHLLTHLASSVLHFGPLWAHSAFVFEDYNQEIRKCIHSSNNVPLQICDHVRLRYALDNLRSLCEEDLSTRQQICLGKLLDTTQWPKISLRTNNAAMIGEPQIRQINRSELLAFYRLEMTLDRAVVLRYYARAYINGELIHSKQYLRPTKRQSYFVVLEDGEIFKIDYFVVIPRNHVLHSYAVGNYFVKSNRPLIPDTKLEHTVVLTELEPILSAVSAKYIKGKVTIVKNTRTNIQIASIPVNRIELLT